MKEIHAKQITETVARLCIESNYYLGEDVLAALRTYREAEVSPVGREVLDQILENADIARKEQMPLCQDCGLTVVFLELGQDVHIVGGDLNEAIAEGVRQGYEDGYLRKSMVDQPFLRPHQHQGQHATRHPHHHRARRRAQDHRGPQRWWQREHEPVGDAQARRWS